MLIDSILGVFTALDQLFLSMLDLLELVVVLASLDEHLFDVKDVFEAAFWSVRDGHHCDRAVI